MKNNFFIVVDGIDGAGKSEIVKKIHNYLFSKNKRFRILTTREPTNGEFGRKIREIIELEKDPLSNMAKLIDLFIKDRQQHLEKTIEPFLSQANGDEVNILISDRYYYSTIAFQGAQGASINELIEKNSRFRRPDIAFILDLNPETALKRIESRFKEKFEQLAFMKKIRENFIKLPRLLEDNIIIINADKGIEKVFDEIRKHLDLLTA